ncbi:hypothetical protein ONS95_011028 [Cadophora gregata]|uniref:uncharacterized protein n=1 Tax=Cadophora gregata TaxID=51156 RepID=UPI0026DB82F7|nr:uncharacterized protein ONS95_011028 [Cadophora gregata]KAK0119588.1 hypothetical protein ONS95_011028 [Cadophora gregata]
MFSPMQPSRPKLPHHLPPQPTSQQQIRTSSTLSSQYPIPPCTSIPSTLSVFPRNQIEAMPPLPFPLAVARNPISEAQKMILDASKRHPVFFTERLKKAPEGVNAGDGIWSSPVAKGYVFNDGAQRKVDGIHKL